MFKYILQMHIYTHDTIQDIYSNVYFLSTKTGL